MSNPINNTSNPKPNTSVKPLRVYSGGKEVKDFSSINEHHDGSRYKRKKVKINGKEKYEKVRNDGRVDGGEKGVESGGVERVVKDLVLTDRNGSKDVDIRSPIDGTVIYTEASKSGGYGNMAEILDKDGKVVARFAHLKKFNPNVQSGQCIKRGDSVGIQGNTGKSTGTHLHAEMLASLWPSYIEDTIKGNFEQDKTSSESTNETEISEIAATSQDDNNHSQSTSENNSSEVKSQGEINQAASTNENNSSDQQSNDSITYKMIVPLVKNEASAIKKNYGLMVNESDIDLTTATLFCGKTLGLDLNSLIEQSYADQNLSKPEADSYKSQVMDKYDKVQDSMKTNTDQSNTSKSEKNLQGIER
jgi:Peptidase family M23